MGDIESDGGGETPLVCDANLGWLKLIDVTCFQRPVQPDRPMSAGQNVPIRKETNSSRVLLTTGVPAGLFMDVVVGALRVEAYLGGIL